MLRTTNVSVHAQRNSNRNRIISNLCTYLLTRTLACHGGQARYDKPAHFQTTPSRRHLERKSRESTFLMRFKPELLRNQQECTQLEELNFFPSCCRSGRQLMVCRVFHRHSRKHCLLPEASEPLSSMHTQMLL